MTTPTTPHNNEALEVGQEINLFDFRWKIEGIHLGALGQESLIELKSLTHKAGWTGQWEYHPMVFVPEPIIRAAITRANQRASEALPTAQGVEAVKHIDAGFAAALDGVLEICAHAEACEVLDAEQEQMWRKAEKALSQIQALNGGE